VCNSSLDLQIILYIYKPMRGGVVQDQVVKMFYKNIAHITLPPSLPIPPTTLQHVQGERDKALEDARLNQENSNTLWKKLEDMKREKNEMQKRLEQKGFAQRGQVRMLANA